MVDGWAPASRSLSPPRSISLSLFLFLSLALYRSVSPLCVSLFLFTTRSRTGVVVSLSLSIYLSIYHLCHSVTVRPLTSTFLPVSRNGSPVVTRAAGRQAGTFFSRIRGVGWKERAVFSPREPGAERTHTRTHATEQGGGRRRRGVGEVTEVIARCGTSVAP